MTPLFRNNCVAIQRRAILKEFNNASTTAFILKNIAFVTFFIFNSSFNSKEINFDGIYFFFFDFSLDVCWE